MEETIQMKEKTALITGGAGGLGKELAMMLMDKGISVVVLDKIPQENLDDDYKSRLKKYIALDLSDLDAVKNSVKGYFIKEAVSVDILIINAFPRVFNNFSDYKDLEIIRFVNTAYTSQLIFANHFLNKMIETGFGRIIIISSKSGIQGYSSGSLYCSLKAAWITFHESVERELSTFSKDLTITTICPDSFSDQQGNRSRQHDYIVGAVKKIVLKAIFHNSSGIYYPATLWTKLILSLQLLRKLLKLW